MTVSEDKANPKVKRGRRILCATVLLTLFIRTAGSVFNRRIQRACLVISVCNNCHFLLFVFLSAIFFSHYLNKKKQHSGFCFIKKHESIVTHKRNPSFPEISFLESQFIFQEVPVFSYYSTSLLRGSIL